MGFYSNLERTLKLKGISLYRLSKETGIYQSTLKRWKDDNYKPTFDNLKKVADFLEVSPNYLVFGNDHIPDEVGDTFKMTDESMSPLFLKGDVVLYRNDKQGKFAIAEVNGQVVCRMVQGQYLISSNIEYPPTPIKDAKILGYVHELRRYFNEV